MRRQLANQAHVISGCGVCMWSWHDGQIGLLLCLDFLAIFIFNCITAAYPSHIYTSHKLELHFLLCLSFLCVKTTLHLERARGWVGEREGLTSIGETVHTLMNHLSVKHQDDSF